MSIVKYTTILDMDVACAAESCYANANERMLDEARSYIEELDSMEKVSNPKARDKVVAFRTMVVRPWRGGACGRGGLPDSTETMTDQEFERNTLFVSSRVVSPKDEICKAHQKNKLAQGTSLNLTTRSFFDPKWIADTFTPSPTN